MASWRWLWLWMEKFGALDAVAVAGLGVMLAFALRREFTLAIRFALLAMLAMSVGVASKMAYYGWGMRFGLGEFHGMSGHVLRAFAVWPAFGFVLAAGRSRALQSAGVLGGGLVAVAVTATIVGMRVHTPIEAIVGCACGWLVSLWVVRQRQLAPLRPWLAWPLVLGVLCACGWLAKHPLVNYDFETRTARSARQWRAWTGAPPCKVRHHWIECDDDEDPGHGR